MPWVIGIREVRAIEVPVPEAFRRGPVRTRPGRAIADLPPHAWERTVGRTLHFLPQSTGAGPCGTRARGACSSALTWSLRHLVEPLAAYYATYEPPMRFGAKPGPRGRKAA